MTEEEYRADKEARAKLTQATLLASQNTPTPTQEENDLLKLGLMHPDDKASPDVQEMPPLDEQQAMVDAAVRDAAVPERPTPEPEAGQQSMRRVPAQGDARAQSDARSGDRPSGGDRP